MNKLPTINIKGKEYVLVKDRILAFNENFPAGAIYTELVTPPESKLIIMKAKIIPDAKIPERSFTAYSQSITGGNGVNATAALENAETSAVGRALAFLGIGVLESVASADEVYKAQASPKKASTESSVDPEDLPPCEGCGRKRKYVSPGVTKAGRAYKGFYPCISNKEEQTPECKKNIIWEEIAADVAAQYKNSPQQIEADWKPEDLPA